MAVTRRVKRSRGDDRDPRLGHYSVAKGGATQAERDEKYKAAQAERELIQVSVWVPQDKRQEVIELAQTLREEAK